MPLYSRQQCLLGCIAKHEKHLLVTTVNKYNIYYQLRPLFLLVHNTHILNLPVIESRSSHAYRCKSDLQQNLQLGAASV